MLACADASPGSGCHFNTDCPNGGQCVNGQCEPDPCPECLDGSTPILPPDTGVGPTCTVDGKVERRELVLSPGLGVPFRNSGLEAMLPVDLAGTEDAAGNRTWDLSNAVGAVSRDTFTNLWAPSSAASGVAFPEADYVVVLPESPGLLAFFDLSDEALRLLGIADSTGTFTQLVYEPPLDVLRFPLQVGDRWESNATATGTFLGASVQVTDHTTTEVRARGTVTVPAGEIMALELVTTQARTFDTAGFTQTSTTVDFLAECGGFVAKAVSAEGVVGLPADVRLLSVMLPQDCTGDSCGAGGQCLDGRCKLAGDFTDVVPGAPVCAPDRNGIIEDTELPVRAGLSGLFLLSDPDQPVTVDLAGEPEGEEGERRLWRFDADTLGTDARLEAAREPADFWFAAYFPDATYVAVLDAASGTNAVFQRVAGELRMLGLASDVPDRTLLTFATPVVAMKFPLTQGDAWVSESRASGTLEGQEVEIDMHYDLSVDASGHIMLPAGTMPVLRLRLDARQQVVGAPFAISQSTILFVAECLGAVTRVVSGVNEQVKDFTEAREVSRLTVPRCLSSLQCRADATCEAGLCVGGTEPPPPPADAGPGPDTDATTPPPDPDGGVNPDLDGTPPPPDPDGGLPPLCDPAGDGVLTRDEFPLAAGVVAHFRVAASEALPVDLTGEECPQGRCWDFSGARDGDDDVVVELLPIDGLWFEGNEAFAGASYISLLDREQGWFGVMRVMDDALQLLGTASATDGEMLTSYDPPVDLYRFPLQAGDTWTIETTQSGYMNYGFVPIYTNDTYTMTVPTGGQVTTPQGPFRALQVITQVSQAVPFTFLGNDQIVHTFVSECFGIVARVVSTSGETEPDFDRASRIERLAPVR